MGHLQITLANYFWFRFVLALISFPSLKIWVWPERLQTMHLLGFHDTFTTKTSLTRVRAVPRYSFSVETLEGLNTMRPTIGIMPSGRPRVLKPVKGDGNLFGSLLTSRYKKRQPSDKLDGSLGYADRYHQNMFSVPYSDHPCFAEIQEFIELVQPTNIKGIVSSSSCYVDPLYYFGRLCGVNQPPKRFVYKHEGKEGDQKEVVVSYFGNSPEAGKKKRRPVRVDYKRVNVSRTSVSRSVRRGAKIVESDCSD